MAMRFVQVYYDWWESIEPLADGERSRLFAAMLQYARGETVVQLTGGERYLWPMIRAQIDRDRVAYDTRVRTSRENGQKGGRPKTQDSPPKPSETQNNPRVIPETKKTQEEEKEEDKDKEEDDTTPLTPRGGNGRFDEFWKAYPKKVGKGAARKVYARLRPTKELHAKMLAAIASQKAGAQWQKDNGQYIPNPTTWLNQGRWDDEVPSPLHGTAQQKYAYPQNGDKDGDSL